MNARKARRSRLVSIALVLSLAALALVFRRQLIDWFSGGSMVASPTVGAPGATPGNGTVGETAPMASAPPAGGMPGEVDHYTCSMHPSVKEAAPGKCPICGMDLIPVTKE